jgi:hypothetical protein
MYHVEAYPQTTVDGFAATQAVLTFAIPINFSHSKAWNNINCLAMGLRSEGKLATFVATVVGGITDKRAGLDKRTEYSAKSKSKCSCLYFVTQVGFTKEK